VRYAGAVQEVLRLGVDLGGTKTEAVVVRLRGAAFEVLGRRRIATERDAGYAHIVEHTTALIGDVARDAGLSAPPPIGVGMPGSVSTRTGVALVKNSNTVVLNGMPFRRDLAAAVGAPIAFANDANCFALAEAALGAAQTARVAFGVILGTGVGGGVVLRCDDGQARAWDGAQSIAGEWGHISLDPVSGPPCYCGRRGCIEQYLSGPALERTYTARTGERRSLHDISARADAGDAAADAMLAEAMEIFGRSIATVINLLDPDVIVLGGGVSNLKRLYSDGIAAVGRWVFNDALETRIVQYQLGDSAGVLGAALLP
jgi:fructokinase